MNARNAPMIGVRSGNLRCKNSLQQAVLPRGILAAILTLLLSENRRAQRPSIDSVSKMRISCAHKLRSGVCDMRPVYDDTAPKKATNLSINSDLLRKARELDINLSSALEQALEQIVKRRLYETWLEENRAAIESYNEHVERHGVFSDGVRGF